MSDWTPCKNGSPPEGEEQIVTVMATRTARRFVATDTWMRGAWRNYGRPGQHLVVLAWQNWPEPYDPEAGA